MLADSPPTEGARTVLERLPQKVQLLVVVFLTLTR